jgi:hypothetical protein
MFQYRVIFILILLAHQMVAKAQETLPNITVVQSGNKVIVSWKNDYPLPVATLNIQRSYDSVKNFTTIGSVLNPQNRENGYADANPPYSNMYYRVFLAFEGGSYVITGSVRPTKDSLYRSFSTRVRYPWQLEPKVEVNKPIVATPKPVTDLPPTPNRNLPAPAPSPNPNMPPPKPEITFPSKWIYTAKDNNIILHLPQAAAKKYSVIFYNELDKKVFELNNLKEEYLIIEKVNFVKSGWYRFELFDNGMMVEKNKILVPKDGKITNEVQRKNKTNF